MSYELLDTAEYLLLRSGGPTPADTCRAASTVYYAMFHCLSKTCCDLFVGPQLERPPQRAWQHLYRSLSHATINERCRKMAAMQTKGFPVEIRNFAQHLRAMQWKRESLDYSFSVSPNITYIQNDIKLAGGTMRAFLATDEKHLRAFAVYVLFGEDRHEKKLLPV